MAISDRTTAGKPVYYWPQFTHNDEDITFWPVPDLSTYTLTVDYRLAYTDQDERTDVVEVPAYWLEAVSWNLAERLIVPYGKAGTPSAQHIIARAADLYANAAVFDAVQDGGAEVQFVPGYQG
jgi:hypothetical protein